MFPRLNVFSHLSHLWRDFCLWRLQILPLVFRARDALSMQGQIIAMESLQVTYYYTDGSEAVKTKILKIQIGGVGENHT